MSSSKNNIAIVKGLSGRGRDYWYIVPGSPDFDKCARETLIIEIYLGRF